MSRNCGSFVVKAHVTAVIDGPKATVQTPDENVVFYAYIPEDNTTFGGSSLSIKDFSLIKFEVKDQQRMVNTATVSAWGSSSGVDGKSAQNFTSEKVKPGIYKIIPIKPLPLGEYAFQQLGSYFDFGVVANQ